MQEDIDLYIETAEEGMQDSMKHLQRELLKIRSGKANPAMLEGLKVDYYGSPTPINNVANIKVTDGRTLEIAPWEKKMLAAIEQAIFQANLGVTPQNDGKVIRLVIPPLTEQRRKDLAKQAKAKCDDAKVSIRSSRQDAMKEIKSAVKDGYPEDAGKRAEETIQEITNKYTNQVDRIMEAKEKEIMTI